MPKKSLIPSREITFVYIPDGESVVLSHEGCRTEKSAQFNLDLALHMMKEPLDTGMVYKASVKGSIWILYLEVRLTRIV